MNVEAMQKNLRFLRKALGWSAQRLGEEIGVTRQTINNLESGKVKLSRTQYLALLFVFIKEVVAFSNETKMFQYILYSQIISPDDFSSSEFESSLNCAKMLIPSISTSVVSRKDVSDEWIKYYEKEYQECYKKISAECHKVSDWLEQINPANNNPNGNNEKELNNVKTTEKINFTQQLEEHRDEVINAIERLFTSCVLEPVRHELWMYINDDGEMSLRTNIGYGATMVSDEARFFIFSCGGENLSAWNLLPRISYLLSDNEEYDICLDEVANSTNKERNLVTTKDFQDYIEAKHPQWIEDWLDKYFISDPSGHIEDTAVQVYDNLINRLNVYDD